MRIENTDRFRNKFCKVIWKDGTEQIGLVQCIPNCTAKYYYHSPGWFLLNNNIEIELKFKDLKEIIAEDD